MQNTDQIQRPEENEASNYVWKYIEQVNGNLIHPVLTSNLAKTISFFQNIPADKWEYRYAENKWTIKQILQHLIETERIMMYRALRISRGDQTALPGFDENDYVDNSNANTLREDQLISEYMTVRKASISMYQNFSSDMLLKTGIASDNPISVRALAFMIAGHENHHMDVIKERYL